MPELPLDACLLGGLVIESLIYGIFLVLSLGAFYVLVRRESTTSGPGTRPVNNLMMCVGVALFCCITAHWIVDVLRAFDAFILFRDGQGGPSGYYEDQSNIKALLKNIFYIIQVTLGDMILTWRLWVVSGHNVFLTLLPALATIGFAISGFGGVVTFSKVVAGQSFFASIGTKWITAAFALTLFTNLYSTPLIAFKIWQSHTRSFRASSSGLTRVIQILVESAAIYTAFTLFTFIAFRFSSNIQFPGVDATSIIVGVAFSLIIVRVGLGIDASHNRSRNRTLPNASTHFAFPSHRDGTRRLDEYDGSGSLPMEVVVDVHSQVHDDQGSWVKS